jgi:hypothetical protein
MCLRKMSFILARKQRRAGGVAGRNRWHPNFLGRAGCERKGAKHPNCSLAPHDASGATGHHRRSRLTEAGRLAAMIYAAAARTCEEIA